MKESLISWNLVKDTIDEIPEKEIILFTDGDVTFVGEWWGDKFLYMAGCHLMNYTQETTRNITLWAYLPTVIK